MANHKPGIHPPASPFAPETHMTPAVLLLLTLLGLCALGALILWHACIAALLRTCKRALPAPDFTEEP